MSNELAPLPDIEPRMGDVQELEGIYQVDPIPGGKRFQGAWLVLDDGTRYVIAYRPVPAHFGFLDKRVRVIGRTYAPGSDVQHVGATHLEVHSIALAPGEVPYVCPPTEVIPPPVARTAAELAQREGYWAQVIGTVESVDDDPDGYLGIARLLLSDGARVLAPNVLKSEWTVYRGRRVIVVSRVARSTVGSAAYELVGWRTVRPNVLPASGTDSHEAPPR